MTRYCRRESWPWDSRHSPGLPGMTRETRLLPQWRPTLHLASTALDASPDPVPGPTQAISPRCHLQLACTQVCWKNQTLPHVRETCSGNVSIQSSPTHGVFLGPRLWPEAEHEFESLIGLGSNPHSQHLDLLNCSHFIYRIGMIMRFSESSGGWKDMADVRGPGTKLLTKCPLLPFFQAASPGFQAGKQKNWGHSLCHQGTFSLTHGRGKTNPYNRTEDKTGSNQTLKEYVTEEKTLEQPFKGWMGCAEERRQRYRCELAGTGNSICKGREVWNIPGHLRNFWTKKREM